MPCRLMPVMGSLHDPGDVSTHPSIRPNPSPNPAPIQTLDLTHGRVGTSPETWIDPMNLGQMKACMLTYFSQVAWRSGSLARGQSSSVVSLSCFSGWLSTGLHFFWFSWTYHPTRLPNPPPTWHIWAPFWGPKEGTDFLLLFFSVLSFLKSWTPPP